MIKRMVLISAIAALSACSSPEDMNDTIDQAASAQAQEYVFTQTQSDEANGLREFEYSWPAQVSAIPALAAIFEEERANQLAQQKTRWQEARQTCPDEFVSCRSDSFALEWQVVADMPGFLSLSNSLSTYTGGAHPNYGRSSTVWDRKAQRLLDPLDLFVSAPALQEALGETACALLNEERAQRRGGQIESDPDPDDWASACVGIEDTVLFLGSSNGEAFDRIGIYYGPYVAGAYAEGDFEFTVPVTQPVLDAVKPSRRKAFALAQGEGL